MAITVRPHLTNDFVLTVDGTQFASADAREVKSTTIISYIWPTTLEWAEDDTVELSLTLKDSTETSGTPQQAEIWSATLTVGTTDEFAGYTTFLMSSESNILGSLSSDIFTLDGAIYTAKALGVLNGKLIFSVMPKLSADFVMVVGTDELASTDAATQESASVLQYQWNGSGLTWSEGEEVAVRLTAPDDNTPPTGLPTISGTAELGETLTADTSGIADENGMDNVEFSYQWIRVDDDTETEIEYAAASTYKPGVKDVHKKVKIEVTFTDEDGHEESLTSKQVGPVSLRVYADSLQKMFDQYSGEQISNLPREFWSATMTAASIEDTHVGFYSGESPAGSLDDPTFTYLPGDDFDYTVNLVALDDDYLSVSINGLQYVELSQWTLSVNGQEFQVDEAVWNYNIMLRPGHPATEAGMTLEAGMTFVDWLSDWGYDAIFSGEVDNIGDFLDRAREDWNREPPTVRGWQWPRGDLSFSDGDTVNLSLKDITPPSFDDSFTFVPRFFPIGIYLYSDNEYLDQVNLPSPSDFTITSDDTVVTIGEVLPFEGETIWLGQLSPAIKQGQTVILSYTDPTSADDANAFQDLFGNDAADFTFTVANFSWLQKDISQSSATGAPTINGTAQVGQVLTAETSGIADENGLTVVEYSYQWLFDDGTEIEGATGSTYTLQETDVGKAVKVKVSFRDDAAYKESLTSIATVAVTATVPTEPLSLTVSAGDQIQELDVSWQAPSSNGGSDVTGYKVQWKEATHSWDTSADVSQATVTGISHTITSLTGGVEYTVRVIASNVAGDGPASTEVKGTPAGGVSEQQAVDPANSAPIGLPTINGTPQVEQTLTADTSGISDADGLTNVSYEYQWIAGGTDISGATGSTYKLTGSEQGKTIQVRVTFTDDADNQETLTSEATVAVAAKPNTAPTGLPTISGTPQVEQTLTANTSNIGDADGLTNVSYEYRWIAGGTDIAGATGSTYKLTGSEQGQTIQVRVTFTDDADNEEALTSAATVAVAAKQNTAATGLPTISGTPQVEQTLTADTADIGDADGLTNVSYEYRWIAGGTDIEGATGSSYLLTSSEQGQTIQVRVTFTDDADNQETLTSEATVAVAAAPNREATGKPTIGGTPQVDQTLTADTSPIDDADGLTNVSYEYQWIADGTDIAGATGSTYELTGSEQGQTIQVRVTFTDDADNSESLTSEATDAVAAKPVPLTATFSNVPASHSGSGTTFTFDLAFSENFPLSYITLRDHAFSEDDDGPVTRAQRKVQGSNQTWTITVEPKGNGAITVTLPATTDCNDSGAICTSDGRKLSNSLSFTVSGPDQ